MSRRISADDDSETRTRIASLSAPSIQAHLHMALNRSDMVQTNQAQAEITQKETTEVS